MYSGVMSSQKSSNSDLDHNLGADLKQHADFNLSFAKETDLSYRTLVKAGFARPESARKTIEDICKNCENNSINVLKILESINRVEDPDYAILAFKDIYQSQKKTVENIAENS
ncbi:hypothetical protein CG397_04550, partial [Gardnerella vaginalis]